MQERFVDACWDVYLEWDDLTPGERSRRVFRAAKSACRRVGVTEPSYVARPLTTFWGLMKWSQWEIDIEEQLFQSRDERVFLEGMSTVYHETRHVKQYFRIAQGVAGKKLFIFPQRHGRTFMDGANAVEDLATRMDLPDQVAARRSPSAATTRRPSTRR